MKNRDKSETNVRQRVSFHNEYTPRSDVMVVPRTSSFWKKSVKTFLSTKG